MEKPLFFSLFSSFFICTVVYSQPLHDIVQKKAPFDKFSLYDPETLQKKEVSENELKAHRVYFVRSRLRGTWHFALTNEYGKFVVPEEDLYPGAVLPARFFGLNTEAHYQLEKADHWLKTERSEIHYFSSESFSGKIKIEKFIQLK